MNLNENRERTLNEKINNIRKELNLPVRNERCFIEEKINRKDDEMTYLPFHNRFSRPATTSSLRAAKKIEYKSRPKSRSPSTSKQHWRPTGANYYYDTHVNRSKLMEKF